VDQLNAEKYRKEEELRKQEEYLAKQEAIKRKTLEYEAELRQQTELARVKAETEGRIRQERQNHDLRVAQVRCVAWRWRWRFGACLLACVGIHSFIGPAWLDYIASHCIGLVTDDLTLF